MKRQISLILICLFAKIAIGQTKSGEILLPHTSIKNQCVTGTCWCFCTCSFLESELKRLGYPDVDISEMYIVGKAYQNKAKQFVRMEGNIYFSEGGQCHDVIDVIREHGMMPESAFTGRKNKSAQYDHEKLFFSIDSIMKPYSMENVTNNGEWSKTLNKLLASGIGSPPKQFRFENKLETASSFLKLFTRFNPDDYLEVTSYSHHPYHTFFVLEDKYNWSSSQYYNLNFEEFTNLADFAISNGYTLAWLGDVTESKFNYVNGKCELDDESISVTELIRQSSFDDRSTSMDHGMHLIGKTVDEDGNKFYILKNSWGDIGQYHGLIYMSEKYFQLKTIALMVHKDVLKKMNINIQ